MKTYAIALDIGTTSTKAVLFTETGTVVAQHSIEYPLYTPTISAAEQEPEEIWTAVTTSVNLLIKTNKNAETYQKILPLYTSLLKHLQAEYTNIAQLQDECFRKSL